MGYPSRLDGFAPETAVRGSATDRCGYFDTRQIAETGMGVTRLDFSPCATRVRSDDKVMRTARATRSAHMSKQLGMNVGRILVVAEALDCTENPRGNGKPTLTHLRISR